MRRTRRRTPVPASLGRRECPTATTGWNGAAARIAAAHRIGRQRVKPTARHPAISDPPTDLGTWSTAVDRKRTIAASREPDTARWPLGAARRSSLLVGTPSRSAVSARRSLLTIIKNLPLFG